MASAPSGTSHQPLPTMDSNDPTSDATQGTRGAPHTITHCDGYNASEMSFELGPPSPHVLPDLSFEAIFNSTCKGVEGQVWETRQSEPVEKLAQSVQACPSLLPAVTCDNPVQQDTIVPLRPPSNHDRQARDPIISPSIENHRIALPPLDTTSQLVAAATLETSRPRPCRRSGFKVDARIAKLKARFEKRKKMYESIPKELLKPVV